MAAISRRGQAGRIYNNTRARVLLRRMCVKPADRTTHSPPKTFARPRTATRPSRALPLPHAAPTHARRLRDARPPTSQPIPRRRSAPTPAQRRALPLPSCHIPAAQTHARRPHNPFPPKTFTRPRTATRSSRALLPRPRSPDAHPQAAPCIPLRRPSLPHAAPTHAHRPHNTFPAQRHARPRTATRPASPSVPLRAQKNGTAQWMCDAECLGRPSLRSVIWVGEPRAVRRRCGALAWRVGLRPQPWALRSRRCGRVLRA